MRSKSKVCGHTEFIRAKTGEGFELPVIDIANPRFAVDDDPHALDALREVFFASERRRHLIPKFLMRMMLRSAARKSRLMSALFYAQAGFLDGITTYVMKLGADNLLPPFDRPIDRRLAASPHVLLLRLRLQQTAGLIARGVLPNLTAEMTAPLFLINIGGGPALDSINALILLNRQQPELVRRHIGIHVLDSSGDAATFGINALAALQCGDGPLRGLNIGMQYHHYDWNIPSELERLVKALAPAHTIMAASSEGALFEYGTDEAIVTNLKVLRAVPGLVLVAGSVTAADETRRRMIAQSRFKLIPRGIRGFEPLAEKGGFRLAAVEPAFLSDQVLLLPA
jgi:hypothetical protein